MTLLRPFRNLPVIVLSGATKRVFPGYNSGPPAPSAIVRPSLRTAIQSGGRRIPSGIWRAVFFW